MFVWCRTHSRTPRKIAHTEPATAGNFTVTLGHGVEDRVVNLHWSADGIDAEVSVSVETLRLMLAAAESYKPGATLGKPR